MSALNRYDSEDRRTLKTVDGVMSRTLWPGTQPVAQYDTNGAPLGLVITDGLGFGRLGKGHDAESQAT
ncbi:hypothetical protein [Brevundimonas sp.]|uniref:hypothetical protein n=1 Tax=Brevundimonas sp. TaxID=1871086 RepID=UPI001A1B4975|nr:hypothetical protein [Brevundimonas sp.]MBJ7484086.1 hypothetical protein [Brevundimonas sp.]